MKKLVFISILLLNILVSPGLAFAQCSGLSEGQCGGTSGCIWDSNAGSCINTSGGQNPGGSGGGQNPGGSGPISITNPINCDNASGCVAKIAQIVSKIALAFVVVFIIYSGFLFVTAMGNEEKLEKAKSAFFWAVIGTILIVGAYAISLAIENFAKQL